MKPVVAPVPKKKKPEMVGETIKFKSRFKNKWSFLSNFWPDVNNPTLAVAEFGLSTSPLDLTFAGFGSTEKFRTTEHFYQNMKFLVIDPTHAELIFDAPTAQEAKRLAGKGAYVKAWWEKSGKQRGTRKAKEAQFDKDLARFRNGFRDLTMLWALLMKFTQSEPLQEALLSSGEAKLVEQGRFKSYWTEPGENALGRMLMVVRDYIPEFDERPIWTHLEKMLQMFSRKANLPNKQQIFDRFINLLEVQE